MGSANETTTIKRPRTAVVRSGFIRGTLSEAERTIIATDHVGSSARTGRAGGNAACFAPTGERQPCQATAMAERSDGSLGIAVVVAELKLELAAWQLAMLETSWPRPLSSRAPLPAAWMSAVGAP